MTWNFRLFLLGLAMLAMTFGFLTRSHAADANVTWENPTTWDNDEPLLPASIEKTVLEWGRCTAEGNFPATAEGTGESPGAATAFTARGLAANVLWCFRAATVAEGQTSSWSTTATGIFLRRPKPPRMGGISAQSGSIAVVIQ